MSGICIASDEDVETGYMLVNDHTPATADERLAMFVLLAAREWDLVFDPRKVGTLRADPLPMVDDPDNESWRPPELGEEPTHRWYVFTDLYEAQQRGESGTKQPREELIEKASRAIGNPSCVVACPDGAHYPTWQALAPLVAIGLIPEHVTATEER